MNICPEKNCTGCFACKSICPMQAVSIKIDNTGKAVPFIAEDKCVSCDLCKNVCPEINKVQKNTAEYAIASVQRIRPDRLSSSGGVATVLAEKVIEKGGVVFGCASKNGKIEHVAITNTKDLALLKGSKYVYSENNNAYKSAKEFLDCGKLVLYIGTPCQVAGLKNFLRKDYENLFTVDLICHGTPPTTYLEEHIKSNVKNKKWDRVAFRGEKEFYLSVYDQDKLLYSRKNKEDLYFSAFLEGLTYRESCYSCDYASIERCADITLGDFWGLDRSKLGVDMQGRISLVLPNTQKGEKLLNECEDKLMTEVRPLEEAVNEKQGNLKHPSKRHEERDEFLRLYEKHGFTKAITKTKFGRKVKRIRIINVISLPYKKFKSASKKILKRIIKRK